MSNAIPQSDEGNNLLIIEPNWMWCKVRSVEYVAISDGKPIFCTAVLFSACGHRNYFRYVDFEHGLVADKQKSESKAKMFFEKLVNLNLSKIFWAPCHCSD